MTQKEQAERRHKAAMAYKDGKGTALICRTFGISEGTLRKACTENGVPWKYKQTGHRPPNMSFRILWELQNTTLSYTELGDKLGVTRQRIGIVATAARKAGFTVREKKLKNIGKK